MHSGASKTEFVQLRFTTGYPDSAPSRHIPESNWNELELPVQHQDVVLLDVGREGADKKLDYHRALKGAFYVFTRAKRESYTVV